jgi:hypothetical protein
MKSWNPTNKIKAARTKEHDLQYTTVAETHTSFIVDLDPISIFPGFSEKEGERASSLSLTTIAP